MKKFLDLISEEMMQAFEKAGYDAKLGKVTVSNRPDLCEYQCNGAMAGAKLYKKAPLMIANDVAAALDGSKVFDEVSAVAPGFLNLKLNGEFLLQYVKEMSKEEKYGLEEPENPMTIIVDYGGPNVAKPLHVGHLRSAVIGESVKLLGRYMGHKVIGDIHLGDWGLQMGLVITEIKERYPDLVYFDDNFEGEYPAESPVSVHELEEIYPTASGKSKEDPEYKAKAMEATFKLQSGVKGYRALWKQILAVSVADMKRNYNNLKVEFDLWKGESDVHDMIPDMVEYMKKEGYAYLSDGALVVDVKEETDTKEIPPCIILKSDGASLYNTTDLATILDRKNHYNPDLYIYLTDKRQDLYFEQVFRCAKKTKLVDDSVELRHIGFGTVNGKDGHAFKTREGGVMRLEKLISDIQDQMYQKIMESREVSEEEAKQTAKIIALAAIKYGDLSNQPAKDYIFDIEKFTSFEGDTGPYILYTIVRIKSILNKALSKGIESADPDSGEDIAAKLMAPDKACAKDLMKLLTGFNVMMEEAFAESAPNKVCAYMYDVANAVNRFYHENHIMTEENKAVQESWIALLKLSKNILESCTGVLGFDVPDRM